MLPLWKTVKGYEGLYIVNNYGTVISFHQKKSKILKMTSDKDGYLRLSLCKKGSPKKTFSVHSLVGNAFIGERIDGLTFDHIDRNRQNNRADNIRLATQQEQTVNTHVQKNNKLGVKNIRKVVHSGKEYYRIHIFRTGKTVVDRSLRTDKYTLEQIIQERDKELLKLKD